MVAVGRAGALRRAGSFILVLGFEILAVVLLQRLGRIPALRIPWEDLEPWLLHSAVEDVLAAVVRMIALVMAYWLLGSHLLYALARASRVPAAIRAVSWCTLPAIRRVTDHAIALTLATSIVGGGASAGAAPAARPTATAFQDPRSGTIAGAPYRPQPAGTAEQPAPYLPQAVGPQEPTPPYQPRPAGAGEPLAIVPVAQEQPTTTAKPYLPAPAGNGTQATTSTAAPTTAYQPAPAGPPSTSAPPSTSTTTTAPPSTQAPEDSEREEPTTSTVPPYDPEPAGPPRTTAPPPATGDRGGEDAEPSPSPRPSPDVAAHQVREGDNLWTIAERHLAEATGRNPTDLTEREVADYWLQVIAANRNRLISGDPDLIYPGESIHLPTPG